MAIKVILPKQGLQMTEGIINGWLAEEGDIVEEGKPLFEIETDKVTIEIDAPASGTLLKIIHRKGETVPVAQVIGIIGEENEDISELLDTVGSKNGETVNEMLNETLGSDSQKLEEPVEKYMGDRIFASPRAKTVAAENGMDYRRISGSGPEGMIIERDVLDSIQNSLKATPLARKIAQSENIALSDIKGSGPREKIVKSDVLSAVYSAYAKTETRAEKVVPFAGMRKVIADRMTESLHTAAQATHRIKVDMSEAKNIRETFKAAQKKVSYNDIITYAVCRALKDFPIMNSELTDEGIVLKEYVNLGIAVAIDNGLIVPVIHDADLKSIEALGARTRELADKAKTGKLMPDEYSGGTFTISNLGMFGLDSFTAVINPPESGILAVGMIEQMPVAKESEIVIRPILNLTLTYDHRVVDGAPAAQFLSRIKEYLEKPYLLL